jgi:transcriptional regulator with XRE-family HTH domain
MANTLRTSPIPKREIFYYRQRMKNRVFAELASFFANEAAAHQLTKREIAYRLQCDPALITRWLSAPGNVTLETISDLLLALNAEMDTNIVRFADRAKPNYVHPLIAYLDEPKDKLKIKKGADSRPTRHPIKPAFLQQNSTSSSSEIVKAVLEPV